jgi:hypothetical protein
VPRRIKNRPAEKLVVVVTFDGFSNAFSVEILYRLGSGEGFRWLRQPFQRPQRPSDAAKNEGIVRYASQIDSAAAAFEAPRL